LTRKTVGGFNPHRELQRRVDAFLQTPAARELGMYKRPDVYETAVILLLLNHDKELLEALKRFEIDVRSIRRIVKERRDVLDSLAPKDADHEKERSPPRH
jgi:hypothetical protein